MKIHNQALPGYMTVSVIAAMLCTSVVRAAEEPIEYTLQKIRRGETHGGLSQFVVTESEKKRIGNRLPTYPLGVPGRYVVAKTSDPEYEKCAEQAKGQWVEKLALNLIPLGSLTKEVVQATDFGKVTDCNAKWHQKVLNVAQALRFEAIEISASSRDAAMRKYLDGIVRGVSAQSMKLDGEVIDQGNSLDKLKNQMKSVSATHRELVKIIAKAEDAEKTQELNSKIEAGAAVVQMLGSVAFRGNPANAARVGTAANSIAQIAKSVVRLRSGGLDAGMKAALSLNIANAGLAMISMFGPMGKDPTAEMIQSGFEAVREDIHELRKAMDDRFDRVEQMLGDLHNQIQARFDRLDQQYQTLANQIATLEHDIWAQYGITGEGIAAALNQPYWVAYQTCTKPGIEKVLDAGAFTDKCLGQMAVFADSVANQKVVSGEVLVSDKLSPEDVVQKIDGYDASLHMELLRSSLVNGSGHPGAKYASIVTKAPSPRAWAAATDTYLAMYALAPKVLKNLDDQELGRFTRNDWERLSRGGRNTIELVAALRTDGVREALAIYRARVDDLARKLGNVSVAALGDKDLGITKRADYRFGQIGWADSSHLSVELHRGEQVVSAIDDKPIEVLSIRRRRMNPADFDVSGGNAPGRIEGYKSVVEQMLNEKVAGFGLDTYGAPETVGTADSIREKSRPVNLAYINATSAKSLNETARKALDGIVVDPGVRKAVAAECLRVSRARTYVMRLAMLYRMESAQTTGWFESLAALPGAESAASPCDDVLRTVTTATQPSDAAPADFLRNWVQGSIESVAKKYEQQYFATGHKGDVSEVDARLTTVERKLVEYP